MSLGQKNQNIKQKQYCNKFNNKDLKNGADKKNLRKWMFNKNQGISHNLLLSRNNLFPGTCLFFQLMWPLFSSFWENFLVLHLEVISSVALVYFRAHIFLLLEYPAWPLYSLSSLRLPLSLFFLLYILWLPQILIPYYLFDFQPCLVSPWL